MAYLYNSGCSHRGDLRTGLQQRATQAAGQASLDGGQVTVEVLVDRMYVKAPNGKSKEELDALLFDRAARRNRTDPYEEKKYRGAGIKEVQAWWKKCQDWMAHFKEQSESFAFDFKKLLMALSDKESIVATSGSERSESASDLEQNDPPSSLTSDAEHLWSVPFWLKPWLKAVSVQTLWADSL